MKKLLTLFSLLLLLSFSVFSQSSNNEKLLFSPKPRAYRAMGEAGLSLKSVKNGFFVNPASLSNDNFYLALPLLEAGVGSVSEITSINFSELISGDVEEITETIGKISGTIPLVDLKGSISLSLYGFGLSGDIVAGVYTSGEGISMGVVPFSKYGVTMGYGRSFELSGGNSFELGLCAHLTGLFYSSAIDVPSLLDVLDSRSLGSISFSSSSLSLSADIGGTFRLNNGLSFSLVSRDMGGDIAVSNLITKETEYYRGHFSLNAGMGWERSFWKIFRIHAALDFVDLTSLFSDFSLGRFLYSTNMGMRIDITEGIGLMCGLKGGFPSFGVDLKLWFIDVSLLYTMDEYSSFVGYNPRDTLSLIVGLEF